MGALKWVRFGATMVRGRRLGAWLTSAVEIVEIAPEADSLLHCLKRPEIHRRRQTGEGRKYRSSACVRFGAAGAFAVRCGAAAAGADGGEGRLRFVRERSHERRTEHRGAISG